MVDAYGLASGDAQNPGIFSLGATVTDNAVKTPKTSVADSIKNLVKTALFMESLRNLNWSRGYNWYAELDGVPNPFQRGGALGLPIKDINFKISEGTMYGFNSSSVETLNVPRAMGELGMVTMSLFDDEQQTLARFFERWYNQIYNPYKGVLPVTEACKQMTIYKQKSTRRNVKRVYYNIDNNISNLIGGGFDYISKGKVSRTTEGYDFLVFPQGPLQYAWGTDANELNSLQIQFQIVHFCNQDFGNPLDNTNITHAFGNTSGIIHGLGGRNWLDKLSNFI